MHRLRRPALIALTALLAACLLPCAGCAHINHPAAPVAATQVINDPIAGAWKGSWHSVAEGGGHHARVSIVPAPGQSTYTLHLQLSRVEELLGGFDVSGVAIHKAPDGSLHFDTKVPLVEADSGNVAEAMKLQGSLKGDTLVINYSTNDAIKDLDHGQIELHRVNPRAPS